MMAMALYHMNGACSLAVHAALIEIGRPFSIVRVDTDAGRTETGADYAAINPNNYVPVLALDDGAILTEAGAILEYLADAYPEAGLAPASSLLARARLNSHLYFIASELHPRFSALFGQPTADERARIIDRLSQRIGHVERQLADGRVYLNGESFSVADAYLFVVLSWCALFEIDLTAWPHASSLLARLRTRSSIKTALEADEPSR